MQLTYYAYKKRVGSFTTDEIVMYMVLEGRTRKMLYVDGKTQVFDASSRAFDIDAMLKGMTAAGAGVI